MKKRKNRHIGGRFDDWLKEEGIYEEATNASIKKVVAWQIQQAMEKQNLTRTEMARRMATSRVQLNRLLDPDNDSVTLGTLSRAATAIGRRLRLELVMIREPDGTCFPSAPNTPVSRSRVLGVLESSFH